MSAVTRANRNDVIRFRDASGKLRYGRPIQFRSDRALVGEFHRRWEPGKSGYVPNSYVAAWCIPFGDIVASIDPFSQCSNS